jgi:hypothetical protein
LRQILPNQFSGREGKPVVFGFMLVLWLVFYAMAVCPNLHGLLHHDAANWNHHCLVGQVKEQTLLAHFETLPPPSPTLVALPSPSLSGFLYSNLENYWIPPGRGPPALVVSIPVVGQG